MDERARTNLYSRLGADGADTFNVFDRIRALGSTPIAATSYSRAEKLSIAELFARCAAPSAQA